MLPRVKITFENGVLGSVGPSADGVAGLACSAVAVAGKLQLATPYLLRRLADLADLGVNAETTGVNAFLYKTVREFYDEAGSGAELWLMCFPQSEIQSDIVNPAKNNARALIAAANGRLRALAVAYRPPDGTPGVLEDGVSANLWPAMYNAQALAEQATAERFAPLIILLEARGWNGVATALRSLTEYSYNRVGVLLGDTVSALNGAGAAVGLLLGRIARIPVQRHIGRVRDGAVKSTVIFLSERKPENTDVETINDRGYITFRTFTGKAGYYFSDDSLATGETDDYRSLARRRTIDKAYRIAYETLVEFL
ncbi:MAG: DUF2586 family protein, partial [Prevotellaceae bacterium]|nr:DUF2586 family protein [Prevotellaceae bacterium]